MSKSVKHPPFEFQVTVSGGSYSRSFEVEKTITHIRGLLLLSDYDELLHMRGSQRIEINKEEFFPERYHSRLLMSGLNVPPNARYYAFEQPVPVGNGVLKLEYKDTPDARTVFAPYTVFLYLDCIGD